MGLSEQLPELIPDPYRVGFDAGVRKTEQDFIRLVGALIIAAGGKIAVTPDIPVDDYSYWRSEDVDGTVVYEARHDRR